MLHWLSTYRIRETEKKLGRILRFPEKWLMSFAEGTLARIDAAASPGEDRRAFIRDAVEREIKRRSRLKA